MRTKKKRTSIITKVLMTFPSTFITGVYIKQDFFQYSELKFMQIFICALIIFIWSAVEDTSGNYED